MMVGFICTSRGLADEAPLAVDENELEDAQWFDKEYVRRQVELQGEEDAPATPGDFHVPSRVSLARTLIDTWLDEDDSR